MQNEPAYLNGHGHVVLPEEQHVTPKVLILVTLKIRKKTICFLLFFLQYGQTSWNKDYILRKYHKNEPYCETNENFLWIFWSTVSKLHRYCIEGSLLVRPDCPDLGIIQGLWYRHREEILQSRLPYQLVQPPPLTTRYRLYTPRSKI